MVAVAAAAVALLVAVVADVKVETKASLNARHVGGASKSNVCCASLLKAQAKAARVTRRGPDAHAT